MIPSTALFGGLLKAHADGGVILKLHYHREDGDYAPWDVWLWPAGGEGSGYAFADEDGEKVATMEVPTGVSSIGFIVRTQDWTKDINDDQFIDISEVVSGTVHAYVESQVEGYMKVYGDDVVTGVKIKAAEYETETSVVLTFTGILSDDQKSTIYVRGSQSDIGITEILFNDDGNNGQDGEYTYTLKLADPLDLNKNYRIGYDGAEMKINMPNVYSTEEFEAAYTYTGNDLGYVYAKDKTTFRVWAPTAEEMYLNRYASGTNGRSDLIEKLEMKADVNGTWVTTVSGDLNGTYYTFTAVIDGRNFESCDPYARSTGINGKRAMVLDLDATDPDGWASDRNPNAGKSVNDAVIYELHIRDFSVDENSGIDNKGKYIAFTEKGTKTPGGNPTGIDYLSQLGITHVHLLPFYDFGSVDESKSLDYQFNWGYDPVNYNVPDGSYSTDPADGAARIKEAKQMVKALHDAGLSVVMDVVYNHVYSAADFCFNRLVPGYFSRINADGSYSNGSGCGNDTASERSMVRKYIVDSVCYWASEYHIDGFRFDLVGLLDVDTINEIVREVHKIDPDIILYGEGWSLSTSVTKKDVKLATQTNSSLTPGFAYFNDNIRDGLKGSVFNAGEKGWISGAAGKESAMAASFMASERWSKDPTQIVNYASCHDNLTLFDKIQSSKQQSSRDDQIRMNNLAAAFYMTAQGIPFMQAGEEILRTKVKSDGTFESNSYSSSDLVNNIKWATLDDSEYKTELEYYKGLIELRKNHPAFRLTSGSEISEKVKSVTGLDKNVVAFDISGDVKDEIADRIFVIFNPNETETTVELPDGKWDVCVAGEKAGLDVIRSVDNGKIAVEPISAMVLIQGKVAPDGYKSNAGASADGGNGDNGKTVNSEDTGSRNTGNGDPTSDAGTERSNDSDGSGDSGSAKRSFGVMSIVISLIIGIIAGFGGAWIVLKHKK
ncbi:MAG: type I pullulanase [Lachnospiraceae bacterium]|nr:type I pullulanase [Lachnospiraceae bacterium]